MKKKTEMAYFQYQVETGDITIDPSDTKKIIRRYYEQFYTQKYDNLDKMDTNFFKKHHLPELTQYEKSNMINPKLLRKLNSSF